ncbi:DUF1045 domain-containing protein [Mesorhizobium sp. PUT5]|uniref:DUF1045 domain-containing protein n=1 Tax=Mesorhizobium sp. PUT5 TaxID=3454629 RepID=UPI003FA4B60A
MRYALYFTPHHDHPLTLAAAAWLGRDAFSGEETQLADIGDLAAADLSRWTAEPRRYGFHATLVAPFRLETGLAQEDVLRAAASLAGRCAAFAISRLEIARLENFLALVPAQANADVEALADAAVDHLQPLRAPLSECEIARRNPARLSARQRTYLERHGYPYVKEEFRFHMTLSGPLAPVEVGRIEPVLKALLAPVLASPVAVGSVSLFVEPAPGAPFTVLATHRLGSAGAGKHA